MALTAAARGVGRSAYDPPDGFGDILHEDESLLAVSKPAGLLSVPGKGPELADCLLTRLQARWPGMRLVHRLDRDTSGVMVFARTAEAQRHLGLQFERRVLRKRYLALTDAWSVGEAGWIDRPLAADWPNRPRQHVDWVNGRRALTRWRVLARERAVRLLLRPETGRSHQLRVHLAGMGHPILGDPLYGGSEAERMMLHAAGLDLRHPCGGDWLSLEAPVPF